MSLEKVLKCDAKTGKEELVVEDITLPTPVTTQSIGINIADLKKLVDYAKKMGWI